jgi:hypothetical protein
VIEDIIIRRATQADREALGKLGASLMHAHFAFDATRFLAPGPHAESGYAAFLTSQLDSDVALVMVAERASDGEPGAIVGYVFAGIEPLSWKELRGPAAAPNAGAQRLFQRHGFRPTMIEMTRDVS